MDKKQVGNLGERIACYYLKKKKYKILEKNYTKEWSSVAKGEIDIIVKKDGIICFVEVKTLSFQDSVFLAEDKVNSKKQRKLIKLAQSWFSENKIPLESKWQIDIISVNLSSNFEKAKIKHFKNIVSDWA